MLEQQLKEVPFFSGLSKKQLSRIGQQVDEIDVSSGKELARQGEFGQEFFVIVEGTADVVRDGARLAELGPGDFFGEMALLEEDRRTATVRATTPMRVLVMTRQSFRSLDQAMPDVHSAVSAAIKERRAQQATAT
jgi:CRP/FNR family transcriptional regulator, cyclic AMP receptor protein